MKQAYVLILVLLLGLATAQAQLDEFSKRLGMDKTTGKSIPLPDAKLSSGLKEALQVGTSNAVKSVGRVDGYFGNAAIKILMPEKMRTLEKGLRAVGYGPQVDEFVLSMNRAAEKAAPAARKIFLDAVLQMTFDDVRKIYGGSDTAATEFFKTKTSANLAAAFHPVVEKATSEAGVTQQYKQLVGRAQAIPFLRSESLDIDQYVVTKALDGLFYQLGQEEKNIRKNPAARVTRTLKEVFGS